MAKDNPILPTPAGRKEVVVVEEKGWERRNASVSLPGAGTGKGALEGPKGCRQLSPVRSLCVCSPQPQPHKASTFCSDSQGLAVAPFRDGAQGLELSTLGFTFTEIPNAQTGTLAS